MSTVTVFRHKQLAISSSACDVSVTTNCDPSVSDVDDDACVVSLVLAPATVSVTTPESGQQEVRVQ